MNKIPANVAPPAGPCCLVIFGASGDLTHRLLVPALYNLAAGGLLPDAFAIIGIARREMSNDAFRSDLAQALRRFAIRGIESGPPLGCSPVPPMSTATLTIRRRMSGSIGNSHRSNAHAPRAATGSSISRRRR